MDDVNEANVKRKDEPSPPKSKREKTMLATEEEDGEKINKEYLLKKKQHNFDLSLYMKK